MSVNVQCACGQRFAANDRLAGKWVKCPKCGQPLKIPVAEAMLDVKPVIRAAPAPKQHTAPHIDVPFCSLVVILALNLVEPIYFWQWAPASTLSQAPPGAVGSLVRLVVQSVIGLLVLQGMSLQHRLAWQWGRVLGLFGAVVGTVLAIFTFAAISGGYLPMWVGLLQIVQVSLLYVIFFSLGQRSARIYFRLKCPQCGNLTNKAADFFFSKAKCRACEHVW